MIGYILGFSRGCIGIMEHEMETTAVIGVIWGLCWGRMGAISLELDQGGALHFHRRCEWLHALCGTTIRAP